MRTPLEKSISRGVLELFIHSVRSDDRNGLRLHPGVGTL